VGPFALTVSSDKPGVVLPVSTRTGYPLLTGDGRLRKQATHDGIQVHGVLWLLDQLVAYAVISGAAAAVGLKTMLNIGAPPSSRQVPRTPARVARLISKTPNSNRNSVFTCSSWPVTKMPRDCSTDAAATMFSMNGAWLSNSWHSNALHQPAPSAPA
jgi:hypothetical protein